jgi:formate dehydrogenase subunit gamma
VSAASHTVNAATHKKIHLPAEILRFRTSERQLHWSVAVPFMVCYATAIVLVGVYNPDPTRPYRALFSWTHRLSGVCMFLLPLWTVIRHRHDFDLHFRNVLTAWRWRFDDFKWLFLMGLSMIDKRVVLPDQGKFNAGEKLNFMFLTASYPVYIITGFLIWLPGVAFASWIAHLSMAALATPLIFGHVYMAVVNPDTRAGLKGMITGYVDRHWAQHHYRHWYNEHFWHLHRAPEPEPERALAAALTETESAQIESEEPAVVQVPVIGTKAKHDKDSPASAWPPVMRPSPGNQAVPETM